MRLWNKKAETGAPGRTPKTPDNPNATTSPSGVQAAVGDNDSGPTTPGPAPASGLATSAPATPRSLKRSADYALRMSHGWTINDGTFDPIPQDKRLKRNVPYPGFVNHAYRATNGLSGLQLSHKAPISLCALDIACDHLWKCMPGDVRRYLHVAPPNGPALWSTNDEHRKIVYEKMDDKKHHVPVSEGAEESEYRFYSDVKKRPWVIWPLWVEDEWGSDYVTVLWYSMATAKKPLLFNQLISYAIIDPRRSPDPDGNHRHQPIASRRDRIRGRLYEFWGKAGFDIEDVRALNVLCSPMPLDEATSGERCFAVVKALIDQIINWFTSNMQYDYNTTITSMSQWVNPFQQRIEITGINAWILMASLDYNARISVEAILPNTRTEVVSNGKKRYLFPYDLAGPYDEPPIAPYDYLLPPT